MMPEATSPLARLEQSLLARAAGRAPAELRERFLEEWSAELPHIGGPLTRLSFGISLALRFEQHGIFRRKRAALLVEELVAERHTNANEFHREASEAEDCDPIGAWPHVHEPHDSKVMPYRFAALCAMTVGLALTKQITEQVLDAAVQASAGGPVEISWKITAITLSAFFAVGKIAEAYFNTIDRKRFFTRANGWYVASLVVVGIFGGLLLIPRVASSTIAPKLVLLEPWAWVGLEQSLIISAAFAWVAARRFDWSRRRVGRDRELENKIRAATACFVATSDVRAAKTRSQGERVSTAASRLR